MEKRTILGWVLLHCLTGCAAMAPSSKVHVNQVGYLPSEQKYAVLESDSKIAERFELLNGSGAVVQSGSTDVKGLDADSGENLHWIRFDGSVGAGEGFVLRVGEERSVPFAIQQGLYRKLKYDALAYFYYNRSGIPVALPWAKDFKWTRPAGHVSDAKVGCVGRTCNYTLDVHGGWYDAGDYGKYVVNGGIALWTLFNLHERTLLFGKKKGDFDDGKLSIPESSNGVPDLLDEARWEMEFILRMQVPEGEKLAGMVHHKIHDRGWTTLGRTPAETSDQRDLYPPSTAATLNLVATAAQCTRVFKTLVPELSERCRIAAIRGWNAAHRSPKLFASPMSRDGGGPYDDNRVSDEFYWAGAELYVTLGDERLLSYLRRSPHYLKLPSASGHERVEHFSAMTWQSTAGLGTLSLAMLPSSLPAEERELVKNSVLAAAKQYLEQVENQGYRVPMRRGSDGHYPWGSNSFVLNNAIVLGVAADLTNEGSFRQGMLDAMAYLLGRNPLGFSYISGYGERALANPHHRFWAHQRGRRCPTPPPGAVAGGPNSKLPDPVSKRLGGCPVQKCYVDHVDAWGVNEVAINWNAPLAWVAAYLDDVY
ncbi:MAG: glycoside hydrolase family 9 protein [Polyangiaceae bacterium]